MISLLRHTRKTNKQTKRQCTTYKNKRIERKTKRELIEYAMKKTIQCSIMQLKKEKE